MSDSTNRQLAPNVKSEYTQNTPHRCPHYTPGDSLSVHFSFSRRLLDKKQHAIAWGDSNGNISILLLSDFADLLHGWRVMQPMEAQPTMSISAVIADPKVSFIRWKTHDEWAAKVCWMDRYWRH